MKSNSPKIRYFLLIKIFLPKNSFLFELSKQMRANLEETFDLFQKTKSALNSSSRITSQTYFA